MEVQSQLLKNQNTILKRLRELEDNFKTFSSAPAPIPVPTQAPTTTHKAAPRNLFPPKLLWYKASGESPTISLTADSSKVNAFTTPGDIKTPHIPRAMKESAILDSSAINKADLLPVETVLAKYSRLKSAGKAGSEAGQRGIFW